MLRTHRNLPSNLGSWQLSDLGAFYVRNKSHFLAHAARRLGDSMRAEEVVHESILKVMLAAPELNSEEHARAYIHRTIENLCMDIFRIEGRRPSLIVIDDAKDEIERSSVHRELDFADSLTKAEDSAIVRQAISLLSPAERNALIMWEIEERSAREISEALGIKESSVRHTVSRARASLRRILSTLIVDEAQGLTGLDMLSRSYGRAKTLAKKSSRMALSITLVLIAFAGFNSISVSENSISLNNEVSGNYSNVLPSFPEEASAQSSVSPKAPVALNIQSREVKSEKEVLRFPGLDKQGIPTGFTIADTSGGFGPAYFKERTTPSVNSYMSNSQIIKTESGAANLLISQTVTAGGNRVFYAPVVSFGRSGEWVPLLVTVEKREGLALPDGNYLFTAYIAVDSAVDSPIRITAEAGGRDLDEAPSRVITRLLLDPSKTKVLFQAVYVIESNSGA